MRETGCFRLKRTDSQSDLLTLVCRESTCRNLAFAGENHDSFVGMLQIYSTVREIHCHCQCSPENEEEYSSLWGAEPSVDHLQDRERKADDFFFSMSIEKRNPLRYSW